MVTISYCITVKDEYEYLRNLLPFLIKNKRDEDEIIVLFDQKNGSKQVEEYLRGNCQESQPKYFWFGQNFTNNFAIWKNQFSLYATKDFLFQIDADEIISEDFINILPTLLKNNPEVDLYWVPRENYVEGITPEYIQKMRWNIDNKGRINYSDPQGRIYRNSKNIRWEGKVHERITGSKRFSYLPTDSGLDLIHKKTFERQQKQNNFYSTL